MKPPLVIIGQGDTATLVVEASFPSSKRRRAPALRRLRLGLWRTMRWIQGT